MRKVLYALLISSFVWNTSITLARDNTHETQHQPKLAEITAFLKSIFGDNTKYMSKLSPQEFSVYAMKQIPRATVVACSDSRVQADAFHESPTNDLFFIRNIGNQIRTTEGSVEYGIDHLHTPVLLIIGHSQCGAVKASLGNYSKESAPIRRELDQLHLNKAMDTNAGVLQNIDQQVQYAMKKFKDKIDKHELIVVGTLYDFRDDFGHGHGRLILVNLNGEKNPQKIKQSPYVKSIEELAIGTKK